MNEFVNTLDAIEIVGLPDNKLIVIYIAIHPYFVHPYLIHPSFVIASGFGHNYYTKLCKLCELFHSSA